MKVRAIALAAEILLIGECLALAAPSQAGGEEMLRVRAMEPVYKVEAKYPPEALRHHIQGTVRLEAVIGKDGHVEHLRLISGHPLLVPAARKAARQWIYRPTLLHGKPVRVATEIDVQFQLDEYGRPLKEENRRQVV